MFIKRNLLCVKNKNNLEIDQKLLFEPYKNILNNLFELCINIEAKNFDPVAKIYDGLLSVPIEIKEYYESLLGITSYYHHSHGGRGKFIEKKIASYFNTCSLGIRLSDLPLWLEYPLIHRKRAIFSTEKLTDEEKAIIRSIEWDWLGDKDVSIDLGNILQDEKILVLVELKNRVDTGGTAGRREIWTAEKFGIYAEYIINNKIIFRKNKNEFSFTGLIKHFGINKIEISLGVLFDKSDKPATLHLDKNHGFYSSNKEGLQYLKNMFNKSNNIEIINEDIENLILEIKDNLSGLLISFSALYGDDITLKLFRKPISVSNILLIKYDDIWFSLLLSIDERTNLLKYKQNFTTILLNLLKQNNVLRFKFNEVLNTECNEQKLEEFLDYLLQNYSNSFYDCFLPANKDKIQHLADIIQFYCAVEA